MSSDTGDHPPTDDVVRAAFDRFVASHQDRLRRSVARSLGRHGGELDDVIQSTYEVLWERRADVLPDHLRAFAFCRAVAENLARKHAGRRPRAEQVADFAENARGFHPDPADLIVAAERGRVAMTVFASLNERQRQVWWLYEVEGLPHREIACILGINVASVAMQLNRARKALRRNAAPLRALLATLAWPLHRLRSVRPQSATIAVPSYVLASLVFVVVGGQAVVRPALTPRPQPVSGPAGHLPAVTDAALHDLPADRRLLRGTSRGAANDDMPVSGKKARGCVAEVACVNQTPPGAGHTLGINWPGVPGVAEPNATEFWQQVVPVCDAADQLPANAHLYCEREGPTFIERSRPR